MTNCRNETGMPGKICIIFLRIKRPQRWIRFVSIHKEDFLPVKTPALCRAHFGDIYNELPFSFSGSLVECNVYKTHVRYIF